MTWWAVFIMALVAGCLSIQAQSCTLSVAKVEPRPVPELTMAFVEGHPALAAALSGLAPPERVAAVTLRCAEGLATMADITALGAAVDEYGEFGRITYAAHQNVTYEVLLGHAVS